MIDIDIRLADLSERHSLRAMQELSLRTLGAAYYDEDVIETFIAHIGTMDETLIEDRTYFAAFVNGALDHDDFGSLRPKIMNVIDSNT